MSVITHFLVITDGTPNISELGCGVSHVVVISMHQLFTPREFSYWGQNSYGAAHGADSANFQKRISLYCNVGYRTLYSKKQTHLDPALQDNAIDVFPIAFLNVFFGPGGAPSINLANVRDSLIVLHLIYPNFSCRSQTCNPTDNATFPGTTLPNCSSLATDIVACQAKGKIVTLSLGGATGAVGFQSDSQATTFGQTIWDMFLGGTSSTRPFGNAILDG
jgi:chitinase